jgi:hypothetical protein
MNGHLKSRRQQIPDHRLNQFLSLGPSGIVAAMANRSVSSQSKESVGMKPGTRRYKSGFLALKTTFHPSTGPFLVPLEPICMILKGFSCLFGDLREQSGDPEPLVVVSGIESQAENENFPALRENFTASLARPLGTARLR